MRRCSMREVNKTEKMIRITPKVRARQPVNGFSKKDHMIHFRLATSAIRGVACVTTLKPR